MLAEILDRAGLTDAEPECEPLDIDTAMDILQNDRRRQVVERVGRGGSQRLSDLAEAIARTEADVPDGEPVPTAARKRAYVSLYQTHLPRMAEVGAVESDDRYQVIRPTAKGDRYADLLALVRAECGVGSP